MKYFFFYYIFISFRIDYVNAKWNKKKNQNEKNISLFHFELSQGLINKLSRKSGFLNTILKVLTGRVKLCIYMP